MEFCIEARALKPSLRREIDVRECHSQAAASLSVANLVSAAEEVLYEAEWNGGGLVDDFLIDDLLDFPEKEAELEEEEEEKEEEEDSVSDCSVEAEMDENRHSTVSKDFDACLAVPQDDLAELEWVSRFVDDTMPEFPSLYPTGKEYSSGLNRNSTGASSFSVQLKQSYEMKMVTAKPRTKRQRAGRVWSVGSCTRSDSSETTSSPHSSSSIISTPVQFGFNKPVMKRQKIEPKKIPVQLGGELVRKCSHCGVQKTPQWRAGLEGAKTLCNACGVRFKSGRLYPEYRPACSPTFREEVHSNSHRKVLEIRKRKEC